MSDLQPVVLNPPLNVTPVTDERGLRLLYDFFQRVRNGDRVLGFDIETNPLKDYFYRRTRTMQFGNRDEQYVIDLRSFCNNDSEVLYNAQGYYGATVPDSLLPVFEVIDSVLCTADFLKVGVNFGFEYQNLYWQFGRRMFHVYDCAMVERCIWAGAHSMKDYGWYSMESMMARYFGVSIDKGLQQSFDLHSDLSAEQFDYAALDDRYPLAIRSLQQVIIKGTTPDDLRSTGMTPLAKQLERLNPIIIGDNLEAIAQIENDAIGAFEDMHVHGERINRAKWMERIAQKKVELAAVIATKLDPIFIPIVGLKTEVITDAQVEDAERNWKRFNVVTLEETALKGQIRLAKKNSPVEVAALEARLVALEAARKEQKEIAKKVCSELKKRRTAIRKLAEKCDGLALINYGSGAQLLGVLKGMKGLARIEDTDDETLEKHADKHPVMAALREYRGLSKEIGTYGLQWATEWTTKPCKDEGWLHPGDGRLHCIFNQYDAETGRSTSEKPNGQNLPQDKNVRSCFEADPPDEKIRISDCCDADTEFVTVPVGQIPDSDGRFHFDYRPTCKNCRKYCNTHAEEYAIVTADMSGAELRIIAELADDPVWIEAFARGEDVHSVGTEILYAETWPKLALPDCAYYKPHTADTVAKNPLRVLGAPQREKCKCPEHKTLRDDNKSTNFLLAYGGGPHTLSARIKKSLEACKELMGLHEAKFPRIWAYLAESGRRAKMFKKAFDMFGRRRIFPEPTWEAAREKAKDDREERLRLTDDERMRNIANFTQVKGVAPKGKLKEVGSELYLLTHREPTSKEIGNAFQAMHGTIERAGKNHAIQGSNASIAKLAMGAGYCSNGKPFLWHTLPTYKARLIKFVHDELVVQCPKRHANDVAALIGDAFKRAAAERMKKVVMEFDFNIANHWKK